MPARVDKPGGPDDAGLADRLRRHDRDRFLASLFAPPDRRVTLWALYAFNLEIAQVRERVSEPIVGQIRLQWWRDMLAEATGSGPVRAHAVALPLANAVRAGRLDADALHRLIDARERDLDPAPFATPDDLEAYAEATAGGLNLAALDALGVADPATREQARRLGIAWALIGLIRAMPHHEAAGRTTIPHGWIAGLAARADGHLDAARARVPPRAALPVLLTAPLARLRIRQLRRYELDPAHPRVQAPDRLASLRLLAGWMSGRL